MSLRPAAVCRTSVRRASVSRHLWLPPDTRPRVDREAPSWTENSSTVNMNRILSLGRGFIAAATLLLSASVLRAQDVGTIEGAVRAAGSGAPLSDVVVWCLAPARR